MLPSALLVASFLAFAVATSSPAIAPRALPAESLCVFFPHFSFGSKTPNDQVAKAEVLIVNKTTEEKGKTGQGFHDNLNGECGWEQIGWQEPFVHPQWKDRSGHATGYNVWFNVGHVFDPACIERAVFKAENQNVTCSYGKPDELRKFLQTSKSLP